MKFVDKSRVWAAAALGVLVLATSPALASAVQFGGNPPRSPQPVTADKTSDDSASDDNSAAASSDDSSSVNSGSDSLRDRAEQLLAQKRQNGQAHSVAVRQKACDQRQTNIDSRLSTLGSKAQKFLDSYNAIFTRVQAYQTKNQLDLSNYDSLVADTTTIQATATSAVATLSSLAGTKIDCTSTDPASTLASVKTAADDARSSLQAYRSSLKALVEALLSAHQAASNNTLGSN